MQAIPRNSDKDTHVPGAWASWCLLTLLIVLLILPEMPPLWASWRNDPSMSHGPFIPLLILGLLWSRRVRLCRWEAASISGLTALFSMTLLYIGAVWTDIDFLKPLALIGVLMGGVWFLGGFEKLRASAGALGLLVFMIPWPTVLVERLGFPLQLASGAYAARFAGMLHVPIHREGVNLYVVPNPNAEPIYNIVVAQQCSGLTSLAVLLLLGYLIAYHTPVKARWRVLLVGAVVPLALLANAIRLTIILLAGAKGSPELAKWIHDHEGPVLMFFCSSNLLVLRHVLSMWHAPRSNGVDRHGPLPHADTEYTSSIGSSR